MTKGDRNTYIALAIATGIGLLLGFMMGPGDPFPGGTRIRKALNGECKCDGGASQ